MPKDAQNYYWLFSSSAQSISAFIAFLIAGYAIVLSVLDSLEEKDETLADIHHQLKKIYYRKIVLLAIVTGLAILSSLVMVFINGEDLPYKPTLYIITALANAAAIILGLQFVLAMINPNRYKNAANEIIKEEKNIFPDSGHRVDQRQFINEFINLEKSIRDALVKRNLYIPPYHPRRQAYSFREMVEALFRNNLINRSEYGTLMSLNKYRNAVFHGQRSQVDQSMLDVLTQMKSVANRLNTGNH